jgi:hypothetical protein
VPDEDGVALVAAGALEDLLHWHGDELVDQVQRLARQDPQFGRALAGVWLSDGALHAEVAARLAPSLPTPGLDDVVNRKRHRGPAVTAVDRFAGMGSGFAGNGVCHPAAVQAQSRRPLSPSARRALLGVLAALTVYLLVDLLVGVRYATDDQGLVVSDVIALAVQAVLVLLVWQRRGWAWIVGAIWAVLSAVGAVAQFLDPTIGGYDADAPRSFVAGLVR